LVRASHRIRDLSLSQSKALISQEGDFINKGHQFKARLLCGFDADCASYCLQIVNKLNPKDKKSIELSYSLQLQAKPPSTLQWQDSEFTLADLDKKAFGLSDVFYLLKLCCYENE